MHWGLCCYSASWTLNGQIMSFPIHFYSFSLNEKQYLSQRDHRLCVMSLFHGHALKFPIMPSIWPAPPAGGKGRQMCLFHHQFRLRSKVLFLEQDFNVDAHLWKIGYSGMSFNITCTKLLPHCANFLFSRFQRLIIWFNF